MAEGEVRIKELEEVTTLTQNHYFIVDDSSSGGKSKKYQADKVTALLDNALLNEASSYDTTHTYNEGDYCLKDNVLYRCLYDNVTGTWTASKWVQTSLGADLTENTNDTQQAFVEGTASGTIATFTDGSNLPLKSLTAYITALQDLHGYDSPWVGGSGRNLFNMGSKVDGTIANITYTSDDEYLYMNGTKQGGGYADLTVLQLTLSAGTYYLKAITISGTASNSVELYPYDGSANLTSSIINTERTLTLEAEKTFRFRFAIWTDGTVLNNYKLGIVISKTANIDKFYPYSNECPISGWSAVNVTRCGKNLFDKSNQEAGWYYGNNIIGSVATIQTGSTSYAWHKDMFIKGGNTYTLSFRMTSDRTIRPAYVLCDSNMIVLSAQYWSAEVTEKTFTITPTEDGYLSVCTPNSNSWDDCNIQLEEGSATTYEPYNGNTYSLAFTDGTNPLTVYGGYVDLVSGELVVNMTYRNMGDINWSYNGNGVFFVNNLSGLKVNGNAISSAYKITKSYPTVISTDGTLWVSDSSNQVVCHNNAYTSASDFKTAMNGVQLVYELATPLTYQLTKQQIRSLVGENNIFADTGAIKNVTYRRDNNTVINGLLNNIQFVTQAQYDALPSSKTSNGVLYFITG